MPRPAAMKMVGHKTEAISGRFAIANEKMLREGAAKLEALLQARRHAGGGPAENRQNYFVGAQQQRRSPYRPSAKSPRQRAAECAGMGPSRLEEGK